MPIVTRVGYMCSCGRPLRIGADVYRGTDEEFVAYVEEKRQAGWAALSVHAVAIGGCGDGKMVTAEDLLLFEDSEG